MRTTKRVITSVTKQADDQQDLVAALRGLGVSDSRIKLFRYANYPARPEYIDDIELEIVTSGSLEQFLKEKYGAGSYLARGFANGQWVKDGTRVIHIFGEKKEEHSKNGNGAGDDMWKFLMSQQQQATDRLMAMMQNSNTTMMQVFSAIISSNKPLDLAGVAALMGSLKPAGTMQETLAMVSTVVDLTAKMSGGGGAEPADPMMAMLGAGLDLIKNRSLPAAAAPPQQTAGAPPPAPNPPPQQRPAVDYEQQVLADRLRFLEQLKAKARLGKPAEEWADYIEDNQDEAVCVWLLSMVRQFPWETIAGALAQTDPELAVEPYLKWFHDLYDLLSDGGNDGPDTKNNSEG